MMCSRAYWMGDVPHEVQQGVLDGRVAVAVRDVGGRAQAQQRLDAAQAAQAHSVHQRAGQEQLGAGGQVRHAKEPHLHECNMQQHERHPYFACIH